MEKCCIDCKNMSVTSAEPDYGEFTPGSSLWFYCSKIHWRLDSYDSGMEDYRKALKMAETCKDFDDRGEK